jgi:hypothetical protein
MGKAQVERRKAERAAELGAVQHMAADAVRPAQQRGGARHVAVGQRRAHGGTRHAQAMHLVALHARDVEALRGAGRVEQRVVAGSFGAEAEVVAHQHVARAQAAHQHALDEGIGRERGQAFVEGQHHGLIDAAALQLGQLVAQRRDARRRGHGLAHCRGGRGLRRACREEVARMRLEGQHARGDAAMARLVGQQRQHRLVPAVNAVEAADRQRAVRRQAGMVETAEHAHGAHYPGAVPLLNGVAAASSSCRIRAAGVPAARPS